MEVSIEGLTAKYGETVAVRDLSIEIPDGELLVLLGPSGCGKTTTMRSIVGLQVPHQGRIRIGNREVFDSEIGINLPPNKRDVGMVFQSYAIWPHMTVAENIAFPLRMRRCPREEIGKRVSDSLSMVGLEGFEERSASLLSGGQMQRVALARSVVGRPKTLLLDEPLSNLDAKLRDKLRFELREIQQSLGITTVYVTHDQDEALALADRVAIMQKGEIVQLGPPDDLYRYPNSVFTAKFLGVDNVHLGRVTSASDIRSIVSLESEQATLEVEQPSKVGERVYACIRSEDVVLYDGEPPDRTNAFKGTVASATYLGDRARYHVELVAGSAAYVTAPAKTLKHRVGDHVYAYYPPAEIRLLTE